MAKYFYDKYRTSDRYSLGNWQPEAILYTSGYISGYTSVSVDNITGEFIVGSDKIVYQGDTYNYVYSYLSDGWYAYRERYKDATNNVYTAKASRNRYDTKGEFLETLIAENGTYPDNGIKSGLWYVKTTLAESATLLQPNSGIVIKNYEIKWTVTNANLPTRVELSTDGGVTWKTLTTVTAGIFVYTHNFATETESENCLIRVTPMEGVNAGVSDQSDTAFEIYHNIPPTAPTLTYPLGGEVVTGLKNIAWTLGADAEGQDLKTEISYSVNNGGTWQILGLTAINVTSYSQNFTQLTESTQAKIRIRHFDGYDYGPYATSGIFINNHNVAPTIPTNLAPANGIVRDRTIIQRLSWQHNDYDAQSKFDLQWSTDGGSTWTTVTQSTSNQYVDFNSNTFSAGTITWRVRTYDQESLVSPYSNQVIFTSGAPSNAPTITSSATATVARPTLTWNSTDQTTYQIVVLDALQVVYWNSGEVTSTNKSVEIGADLVNNSTYTVKLKTKNSLGIWTDETVQTLNVSYTPPEIPEVTAITNTARATIVLNIVNPAGATEVTHNDIYRDGVRIATGIMGSYTDYTAESEKEYNYRIRVWGSNGTYSESVVVNKSVAVKHTNMALTTDFSKWIELKWNPEKSDNRQHNSVSNYFAGRKFAVTDFSENENNNIPNSFAIRDKLELDKLIEIYDAKQTVIYRDRRGKRLFGTLNNLSIVDESPRTWWTVSFTLQQVDFDEVI